MVLWPDVGKPQEVFIASASKRRKNFDLRETLITVTSSADLMKQLKARTICSADIEKVSDDEDHGDGDDGTNGTNDGNIDLSDPPTRADELIVDLRTFIAIGRSPNHRLRTRFLQPVSYRWTR